MISEVLFPWFSALVESVRSDEEDLSARQMAILLSVYLNSHRHTVRGLSQSLNISKPAISRAIDSLSTLGYVRRMPDEKDGRSIIIQRTVKGSVYVDTLAARIIKAKK